MTREYFINEIDEWWKLKDFCNEYGCWVCDDIVDSDYRDEWIEDHLIEWARENTWTDLRDVLNSLYDDSSDSYYRISEYDEWYGVDDDFDYYKEDALGWADENEIWDDGNEDGTSEPVEYHEPEEPVPTEYAIENAETEDFGLNEFFMDAFVLYNGIPVKQPVFDSDKTEDTDFGFVGF